MSPKPSRKPGDQIEVLGHEAQGEGDGRGFGLQVGLLLVLDEWGTACSAGKDLVGGRPIDTAPLSEHKRFRECDVQPMNQTVDRELGDGPGPSSPHVNDSSRQWFEHWSSLIESRRVATDHDCQSA